ncbi:hypothetical protein J4573_16625 [Actinomadura barringtoniae]|uniref:Uncharacterized protein n=1 Tax=Actinomadura barringtoniae TaxID=1427535 RepID=A0A939PGE7_9ACTN|nr:hypothetical protein [Actinomadura barringtoniae]MBO2448729.1 hypothetical protein [Actinomadura barringtoniae]
MASLDRPREPSPDDIVGAPNADDANGRLAALDMAARAHELPNEVTTGDHGQNYYVRMDRGRRAPVRVFCRPRAMDGGRLWFFADRGTPVAEASDIRAALVWLKEQAAPVENDDEDEGAYRRSDHSHAASSGACDGTKPEHGRG